MMKKMYEIWCLGIVGTERYTTLRKAQQEARHRTVMSGKVWAVREVLVPMKG